VNRRPEPSRSLVSPCERTPAAAVAGGRRTGGGSRALRPEVDGGGPVLGVAWGGPRGKARSSRGKHE